MTVPVDHDVRRRATHEHRRSMALSAGAGSGKTAVLTTRLVEILATGTPPRRVAAITFTEKAAGELQRRTREALEKRLREDREHQNVRAALARFDELTLSTIHAFCRDLLASEPLVSRWAPGTEIAKRGEPGLRAALHAWRKRRRAEDPRLAGLLDDLLQDYQLASSVSELLLRRDLVPETRPGGFSWSDLRASLEAYVAKLDELLEAAPPKGLPLATKNHVFSNALRFALTDDVHVTRLLAAKGNALGRSKQGGPRDDPWTVSLKEHLDDFEAWQAEARSGLHALVVSTLSAEVLPAVLEGRRADAAASFDDLLFRAAELLADDEARARIADRFDALLIDEVQDTDPIQAEVAALLARPPRTQGDWLEHPPRPGHLFAVGDPKQSIYRFRRADVTVWNDLRELVRKVGDVGAGEVCELRQNFRSAPSLVRWVGVAFADMPEFTGQEPWRAEDVPGLDPVVLIETAATQATGVDESRSARTDRTRADEADAGDATGVGADESDANDAEPAEVEALLSHLFDLRDRGARVVDAETGVLRPMRWGDVMVLLPRWTHAQSIAERFLAAGVEAVVEGGGAFFRCDEVKLSVLALRALDEPGDAEAVVHLLHGLFGLTHEELAAHRAAGGHWRYTGPEHPATVTIAGESKPNEVARAFTLLRELRTSRHESGSWIPLLDRLHEQTRATATWSLLVDGPARLANLDKLRALLREIEAETRSPSEALDRLRELEREGAEDELSRLDVDSDAVRVTTTFKAKGLEAPIVAILDAERRPQTPTAVVDRARRSFHLAIGSKEAGRLEPPEFEEAVAREKEELDRERCRWMYVAATRARDQLVIVRRPGVRPDSDLLAYFAPNALPTAGEVEHDAVFVASDEEHSVDVRVRHALRLPPAPRALEAFPGGALAVSAAGQSDSGVGASSAVDEGGLDARLRELVDAPVGKGDPEGVAWRDARRAAVAAARRASARWKSVGEVVRRRRLTGSDGLGTGVGKVGGQVIHAVLEALDLSRPADEREAEALALLPVEADEAGLGPVEREACADLLRRILAHPVLERARTAVEVWRETPFAIRDRGRVVAGTIDLCFPTDASRERWVVVDWKSDAPPEGSALRASYEAQVAFYAKALLATVAPCQHVETFLVGPYRELAIDPREEALELVMPAFRPLLERLLDAGAPLPRVGVEVGEPVLAELELAWDEARVAFVTSAPSTVIDEPELRGWQLVAPGPEVEATLRAALGLSPRPAEDGAGDDVAATSADASADRGGA